MATYTIVIPSGTTNHDFLEKPCIVLSANEYVTSITRNAISSLQIKSSSIGNYASADFDLGICYKDNYPTFLSLYSGNTKINTGQTVNLGAISAKTNTYSNGPAKGKVLYSVFHFSIIESHVMQLLTDVTFSITTASDSNSTYSGRYNGSSYDPVVPYYYNGSAWVPCEWKRYNGSSWDDVDTW